MTKPRTRKATEADLDRVYYVRHATAENRLSNPALVTAEEVKWYMDEAIFLVSEDDVAIQGFGCANPQTGYIWALFVCDEAHGQGHGTALLEAMLVRLKEAGNRQAVLSTGAGTKAEGFYKSRGWHATGYNLGGEVVLRRWL